MPALNERLDPGSSRGVAPQRQQEGIVVGDHKGIVVLWPDGHRSRFSWSLLRSVCPCVDCRDAEGEVLVPEQREA